VRPGTLVTWADEHLQVGAFGIDLRGAPRLMPPMLDGPLRATTVPGAERSALAGEHDLLAGVTALIRRGAVEDLATLLGGRGPGLTPAGDDVLAGIVLILHVRGFPEARLRHAVEPVRSTDLARAYLRWCARGQCIAPAHDVLRAVALDDARLLSGAARQLGALGASSGADLLLGLQLGLAAPQNGRRASHTALIAT
jgi:hypothetical protein